MTGPLGHVTARPAIWAAIRALSCARWWALDDVVTRSRVRPATVRSYLRALERAGYVVREAGATFPRPTRSSYRLAIDVGVEAPRVRRDGTRIDRPTAQQRIWAACKALGWFSTADMQVATSLQARATVMRYLDHLVRAGYLMTYLCGDRLRYRLVPSRNSGPLAPVIRRGAVVYDPNERRQVWPVEPQQ